VKDYVARGGHVLVIDMPENPKSTANGLLKPFGVAMNRPYTPIEGEAKSAIGLPTIPIASSLEVTGAAEPLMTVGDRVVAARTAFGKGSVTAIGFGAKFNDSNMGVTGDVVPDPEMRKVFDVEFGILRHIVGADQRQPAATQPAKSADARTTARPPGPPAP
jgi:hypothetical protein